MTDSTTPADLPQQVDRQATIMLANFADMANGLLTVVGGGVTLLVRRTVPAPMGSKLVVRFATGLADVGTHRVACECFSADPDARRIPVFDMGTSLTVFGGAEDPFVCLVVPLEFAAVNQFGRHEIHVSLDDERIGMMTFHMHPPTPAEEMSGGIPE